MLHLAIVGPGLVGSEFIEQIIRSKLPFFRIVAISNSRRMLVNAHGLNPTSWSNDLAASKMETDLAALARHTASTATAVPGSRSVIIDCTSSDDVAKQYPYWLGLGLNIVTPNKKAFSGDAALWRDIFEAAKKSNSRVFHESTVGAGLPILSTLKDLVETGDTINRIEGIFSGTLSYLFNNFSSPSPATTTGASKSFSSIVTTAKSLGYTEPDPRDDLNGMDVARKVVILARVAGIGLDLKTLDVQNIVPEELRSATSADDFMKALPSGDKHFDALNEDAKKEGCVLRYVGCVDPVNGCSVKLAKYPLSHPFAALTGSDNIVAFTTKYFPSPLIIQGAGAGAAVTAFGMFSDLLKIARINGHNLSAVPSRSLDNSSAPSFSFIKRLALVSLLSNPSKKPGCDYLIVDVREPAEFRKLHIRTAQNVPSTRLLANDTTDDRFLALIRSAQREAAVGDGAADVAGDNNSEVVIEPGNRDKHDDGNGDQGDDGSLARYLIFHCNLSLIRGPAAAARAVEVLARTGNTAVTVSLLDGGYAEWKREYANNRRLMVSASRVP
ncbi:hypothetical protein HDU86_002028 [Geranomyces michiganensis]|nr:hypothetical protein HDU86_002028 [Geranomyces michiganensis]